MSRFFKVYKNRLFFVFLAAIPAYFPRKLNIYTYNGLNESLFGTTNTSWAKEVINKNAPTHQYNVAIRGGSNRTNFYARRGSSGSVC